jgi:hypothetical protein
MVSASWRAVCSSASAWSDGLSCSPLLANSRPCCHCVPANRAGALGAEGTHAGARKEVRERRDPDQRTGRRSRRPRCFGTPGGRPHPRLRQLRDRDPGRTHDPVHHAAAPAPHGRARRQAPGQERLCARQARCGGGPRRDRCVGHNTARPAAQVADLGPGCGDGPARPAPDRHGAGDLLLRPARPIAARHEREHQGPAAPLLPQGHRSEQAQRRGRCSRRCCPQRPAPQDPRLEDPAEALDDLLPRFCVLLITR